MTTREEGVYASYDPTVGGVILINISRVAGNGNISSIICTEEEARDLFRQLQDLGCGQS